MTDVGSVEIAKDRSARVRRQWRTLAVLCVLVGLAGAATWALPKYLNPPRLQGFLLTPPIHAYDFRLTNQNGQTISLSDFRGKAVALTFLYTHCPDVCPLIADMMRLTYQRLGDVTKRVAFVAVSVDPRGDTPAAVREFLARHRVEKEVIFLTGSFAQLRPVWAHYYVGSDAKEVNPEAVTASTPAPEQVGHTAVVYVIDPQGDSRAFLPGNFDPKDLESDLRLLASGAVK